VSARVPEDEEERDVEGRITTSRKRERVWEDESGSEDSRVGKEVKVQRESAKVKTGF
jgi:hypothetical protein